MGGGPTLDTPSVSHSRETLRVAPALVNGHKLVTCKGEVMHDVLLHHGEICCKILHVNFDANLLQMSSFAMQCNVKRVELTASLANLHQNQHVRHVASAA